jgi:hypothetical protein
MQDVTQKPDVLETFATLVRQHDVTYEYSDDHTAWSRGLREYDQIMTLYRAADHRTKCLMTDIWNEIMRRSFRPDVVDQWLWSQPKEVA